MKLLVFSFACFLLSGCSSVYGSIPDSHKVLLWSQSKRDAGFRAAEDYAEVKTVKAGNHASPLPMGTPIVSSKGGKIDRLLDRYIKNHHLVGLIVLKDGKVALEKYAKGFSQNDRWTSFSMAKSFTSTLAGVAIKDGYIKSVNDKITQYIPNLVGSVYDDVTVRQLLTMTSGVKWSENYASLKSDVTRFIMQQPEPGVTQTVSYMRKLKRDVPAGTKWKYKTGETNLLGVLVSQATGKTLSEYLSEKIWKPYGMEMDAVWVVDLTQHEMGGCCLSASLRDYARYGQFMLGGAKINGQAIVPDDWIENATSVLENINVNIGLNADMGYGYQWWTSTNGVYMAMGLFGQIIFIDPNNDLVIVMLGNTPGFSPGREGVKNRLGFLLWAAKATGKETDIPRLKP